MIIHTTDQSHRNKPTPAQQAAAKRLLVELSCTICGFICGLIIGLIIGSWK